MRSAECGVCMGGRLLLDAPPNTPHSAFRTPHWGRGGDRSLGEAGVCDGGRPGDRAGDGAAAGARRRERDRKSTRLNSSHGYISYAVFCLKKKNDASAALVPS